MRQKWELKYAVLLCASTQPIMSWHLLQLPDVTMLRPFTLCEHASCMQLPTMTPGRAPICIIAQVQASA